MEGISRRHHFKRNSVSFLGTLALSLFVAGAVQAASPKEIHIGFIPGEGVADLKARSEELAQLLEKRTGLKIKPYVGTSYGDLVQKIVEKKIDFAFLSALSFVEVEEKVGVKVLLKKVWDQGFYYSVILSKTNSSVRKPSDLRGKRIAFVDERSASGYLYPQALLKEAGLDVKKDLKSTVFSGGHDKSVELLKKGEVDAIAVFSNDKKGRDSAWTQNGGKTKEARIVWASDAIPNDPFCVRDEFYQKHPKIAHDLMFSLIEMNEDAELGPELKRLLGVSSLMVATSQQ
ncbi:MAG: phosphate/phosphite/phosphonate ABC transporter substrate-binding protein [Bdellovibrionales bacterium]|jgi:phosphonate transport system substrate-binding protein|nr:phosphate/phosphite/phosphonate ABC transporter substrate-binding protein [Bdellovibrionales bacterium]